MSNDDANGFPSLPDTPNDGNPTPPPPSSTPAPPPGFGPPTSTPPGAPAADPAAPPPGFPQQEPPTYAPQPGYGQPDPQQAGYTAPPGYVPATNAGMVKGPRPDVKLGGILIVVGALLSIISVFLPWATGGGASANGMDDFIFLSDGDLYFAESPGTVPIFFGVVMLGLGIALILAGRVLAVAIIAIVGAVISEFVGLAMVGIASSFTEDVSGTSVGIGAIIQPIAPLVGLAGAIVATAKRRRMVPASAAGTPPPGTPGATTPSTYG